MIQKRCVLKRAIFNKIDHIYKIYKGRINSMDKKIYRNEGDFMEMANRAWLSPARACDHRSLCVSVTGLPFGQASSEHASFATASAADKSGWQSPSEPLLGALQTRLETLSVITTCLDYTNCSYIDLGLLFYSQSKMSLTDHHSQLYRNRWICKFA